MANTSNISELVGYLECDDLDLVQQVKSILADMLLSARDGHLVSSLVDKFVNSRSKNLRDILVGVSADQSQYLFDRMNDHSHHGPNIQVLVLLAAVVKKQPSWIYKITESPFFASFIKQLKIGSDVFFAMAGSLTLASLLPCIPSLVGSHMGDMLEVLLRNASLLVKEPGSAPEVLLLHLQVAVYVLLQRLYAMYPNNFMTYMKSCFGGSRKNDHVFMQVIKPMLEFVKFHPSLICDTARTETENEKWKMYQPHDIIVECQKVSLDPLDVCTEARYAVYNCGSDLNQLQESVLLHDLSTDVPSFLSPETATKLSSIGISETSSSAKPSPKVQHRGLFATQDLSSFCSPSEICGLTTPPQSRPISPSGSCNDLNSIIDSLPRPTTPTSNADLAKDQETNSDESRSSTPIEGKLIKLKRTPTKSESSSRRTSDEYVPGKGHMVRSTDLGDSLTKRAIRTIKSSVAGHVKTPDADIGQEKSPKVVKPKRLKKRTSTESVPKDPDSSTSAGNDGVESVVKLTRQLPISAPNSPVVFGKGAFKTYVSTPELNNDTVANAAALIAKSEKDPDSLTSSVKQSPVVSRGQSPPTNPVSAPLSDGTHLQVPGIFDMVGELFNSFGCKPLDSSEPPVEGEHHHSPCSVHCPPQRKPKSPFELLDEFLDCGAQIYSAELTKIPITSQLDTDWTYFGGSTPADELKILKSQVQLLHIQLLYERHKCSMHAVRNRRMAGKVYKAQAYTEELNNIRNQIQLMEAELRESKLALKSKNAEIRQLADLISYSDRQNQSYREYCQEKNKVLAYKIEQLSESNSHLECKLMNCEQENGTLRNKLFNAENQVASLLPKVSKAAAAQRNLDRLAMEIVANDTKYSHVTNALEQIRANSTTPSSVVMKLNCYENEVAVLTTEKERLALLDSASRNRIQELELAASAKDMALKDMKTQWENSKLTHATEIAAMHSKYKSLKKNCQNLHSYILRLYSKIENQAACALAAAKNTKEPSVRGERKGSTRLVSNDNEGEGASAMIEMSLQSPDPDQMSTNEACETGREVKPGEVLDLRSDGAKSPATLSTNDL